MIRPKLSIFRRYRGARISHEYYSHLGVRYIHLGFHSPDRHAWWAIDFYFDLTRPRMVRQH